MRYALFATALVVGFALGDDKAGPKEFQGTWTIVDSEKGRPGKYPKAEPVTARTIVFSDSKYAIKYGDKTIEEGTFSIDPGKTPPAITVEATAGEGKGTKWHGIYELKGDTLRAVVGKTDKAAPADLDKPGSGDRAFTLKRAK